MRELPYVSYLSSYFFHFSSKVTYHHYVYPPYEFLYTPVSLHPLVLVEEPSSLRIRFKTSHWTSFDPFFPVYHPFTGRSVPFVGLVSVPPLVGTPSTSLFWSNQVIKTSHLTRHSFPPVTQVFRV